VPSDAPVRELIENWTSSDFAKFVDELGDVVDNFKIQPGTKAWKSAEDVWQRVVELEAQFWPGEAEEEGARIV
jgi:formylaminopyrimidine deformylase / aminopyrimidine aminohydrolase